jgi:hypothetical protein
MINKVSNKTQNFGRTTVITKHPLNALESMQTVIKGEKEVNFITDITNAIKSGYVNTANKAAAVVPTEKVIQAASAQKIRGTDHIGIKTYSGDHIIISSKMTDNEPLKEAVEYLLMALNL